MSRYPVYTQDMLRTFADRQRWVDNSDETKRMQFTMSNISTGTDREYDWPDADGVVALQDWVTAADTALHTTISAEIDSDVAAQALLHYLKTDHVNTSAGVADAGKPIVLDAAGLLDNTMLNYGTLDHNSLLNLAVGDVHTQYALLAGRVGGQTLYGGTNAGDLLTLESTSNATKGHVDIPGSGLGDYSVPDFDLHVGGNNYGLIQTGDALIGRSSRVTGNLDLDGTYVTVNRTNPNASNILFAWFDGTNSMRFAIPKSGTGNATYNPRSFLNAGPVPVNDEAVTVGYWQTQGIFHNLLCDTSTYGADMGVQNDLEVEGDIFTDSIKGSTDNTNIVITPHGTGQVDIKQITGGTLNLFRDDTTVVANDSLGKVQWVSNDSSLGQDTPLAVIEAKAFAALANIDAPTELIFSTAQDGSETATEAMRITELGQLETIKGIDGAKDTDTTSHFGRAAVGYNPAYNDYAAFGHLDVNTTGGYAVLQSSTGATFLNAASGQSVYHRINNATVMEMSATSLALTGNLSVTGTMPDRIYSGQMLLFSELNGLSQSNTTYVSKDSYANVWIDGDKIHANKTVKLYAVLARSGSGTTAYIQLYNVTDGAAVSGSEMTETSTSLTMKGSSDFRANLASGLKQYTIQLKGSDASTSAKTTWAAIVID
jgi:hypothetical protein